MTSVKKNIVLNGINTVTGIIFPVITFPYAARILLPEGIGAINFLNSIISYIILLTSLGIPLYAVKEVSKYRDDINIRNTITLEILILSSVLSIIGYIIVWLLASFVPQIHKQEALFYVLSLSIICTTIGANWFYQAVEDFKFITTRAIIIRALAAAALFLFVKKPTDLIIYGYIIVGSTVGNNIINFIHLRKYLTFKHVKIGKLRIWRHLLPAFQVFILNLIISLYIQLNSIMLGFMAGEEEVGYFTAGTKISHIGLTIISSLGTVLLPRCSHLLATGDNVGFKNLIRKSLNLTLGISFPICAGLIILSSPLVLIFCGPEYYQSIPVLLLNAPVVIFISLTNVMGIQILYPKDKIKLVILSVTGGAISNLILNLILIPYYGAIGAAIATLCAELLVLLLQIILGYQYYPFKMSSLFNRNIIISTILMALGITIITLPIDSYIWQLLIGIPIGFLIYSLLLKLLKDPLINEISLLVKNKLHT